MRLLLYLGWLLGCCYAVARVLGVVARVTGVVARVLLVVKHRYYGVLMFLARIST